ncbi:MAG: arginine--tRNA ligase [Chitinophagaceae bacterium]|nr:arginine--tRNA ligase [Chitinophagaceae bacterium]
MSLASFIQSATLESLEKLYGVRFTEKDFQVSMTKPEFKGDYSIVFFPLLKALHKKPEDLGNELGQKILELNPGTFFSFNVIKGFLNLEFSDGILNEFLHTKYNNRQYGFSDPKGETVMIEYSSPNTNKPLHLGHLRNIFIGWSMSKILKANGYDIVKTCIVNDRGIHICKSMIAWKLYAEGATPDSTGTKGDHFVGDYYVKFNEVYQQQMQELMAGGMDKKTAEREAPVMKEAQDLLLKWESGDKEVRALWAEMNGWVYKGFDTTYNRIGVGFDKVYYESNTYLLGKKYVQQGLDNGVLFKKEDGSVWIDLTNEQLDEKLLLRSDGTSVYMTQDIGLAAEKFQEYPLKKSIYVIGDEQIYHMKVLKAICRRMNFPFADEIYHLSYGMVELTTGKMKSREGTVVDADDLIDDMIKTSAEQTAALGKVEGSTDEELSKLYEILGLGATKFYLLRVDPKRKMVFDPKDSIDFHGFTGPFVQYTYARIKSILRKANVSVEEFNYDISSETLLPLEKQLILQLETFESAVSESGSEMNPSIIANFVYGTAKQFNSFYTEHSVIQAENQAKKNLRLALSIMTANTLCSGLKLLGIQVPERM